MSVQRIERGTATRGWQARQYTKWPKYLSEFFADDKHGGKRKAKALAMKADERLKRKARACRKQMP